MKLLLVLFCIYCFLNIGHSQKNRNDVSGMGVVEVTLRDSSGVFIMIWDDFTFKYSENHSEIIIIEGYSNKKQVLKAKNIDKVSFVMDGVKVDFKRYKSFKGSNCLLLAEVYQKGDYAILQSPTFGEPTFYYLAYLGEVISLLPANNLDFIQFFNCPELFNKFVDQGNNPLSSSEMSERLDYYLSKCLSPKEKTNTKR